MKKNEVGYDARASQRHRVTGRQARRQWHDLPDRCDRPLDVPAPQPGERPHPLPGPRRVDSGADRGHRPRHLAAEDVPGPEPVAVENTAPDHGVHPADPDRLGGDQHLPGGGTGLDAAGQLAKVRAVTASLTRHRRSDAQDNRERIIEAARETFVSKGLNVPMREIARTAGAGPATLYRHFPSKQALATEAFADQAAACRAIQALQAPA
jgi:Bacterial regulatory proteins, tetR family